MNPEPSRVPANGDRGRMRLLGALAAVSLSGCQVLDEQWGDTHVKVTSLFQTLAVSSDCVQSVDPDTGVPTTATHRQITSSGDAATLHEAGGLAGQLLAFVARFIPSPVPPVGARQPGRVGAAPSPAGSPAVTSCAGERTTSTPAAPPPPGPAGPSQQSGDAAEGRQPYELATNPFEPPSYPPDYRTPLQRRIELAARATRGSP